jgi:hypothetical protein
VGYAKHEPRDVFTERSCSVEARSECVKPGLVLSRKRGEKIARFLGILVEHQI